MPIPTFPIPPRAAPLVGPGSQPADDAELDFMPMPRAMHTFEMPRVPERVDPAALARVGELLGGLVAALDSALDGALDGAAADQARPRLELTGLAPAVVELLNQVLGEGEVAIRIDATPALRIQETVFAGLWRCCELDAEGGLARDWLEAGDIPPVVRAAALAAAEPALPALEPQTGAMNSPALLAEIGAGLPPEPPGRQINLTLLPMTPEDHAALERALPVGPVAMISRGFGNCHITSTRTRDVWRVQYFNTMKTLILNTIELVAMPEVALASAEDLADTRTRLAELVQWLAEAAAESAP